ncbi:tyrosine/serine/threonine protein phosphatase [Coemansia sp. RSA 678]|nr:tyrosine/serine/threonine protein phosphatase [Coemansia sp. RSA 678]
MSVPPNRQMIRASTEPMAVPLPLRQLGPRRTISGHRATSSLGMSTHGLGLNTSGLRGMSGPRLNTCGLREPTGQSLNTHGQNEPGLSLSTNGLSLNTNGLSLNTNGLSLNTTKLNSNIHADDVQTPHIHARTLVDAGHSVQDNDAELARRAGRVYGSGPRQIMPFLYLGGEQNVTSAQLEHSNITRVLNVAREVQGFRVHGVESRHVQWDHNESDLARHFDSTFAYIDEARSQHCGVLVHCQLGVSRSASLVVAYVMRTMHVGFEAAYEYVRQRAPCISPNIALIAQLSEYGRVLGARLVISTRVVRDVPELSSASSENSSDGSVDCPCAPLATAKSDAPADSALRVVAHRHPLRP